MVSDKIDVYVYPSFDILVAERIPDMMFRRQMMVGVNPQTGEVMTNSIEIPISFTPVTPMGGEGLPTPKYNYFDGPHGFILHFMINDESLVSELEASIAPRKEFSGPRIVAPSAGDVAAVSMLQQKPWKRD